MIRKFFIVFLLVLLLPVAAMAASAPQQMLQTVSDQMIAELVANRAKVKTDPNYIVDLVDRMLVPHVDFDEMSKRVLATHRREATPAQRERFKVEFSKLVVRTYSTAFRQYTDQKVEFFGERAAEGDANRVEIKSLIKQDGGQQPIPVNYRLINKNGEWKVYDLNVDGVSLVSNFREQFSSSINNQGLDTVINDIAARNKQKLELGNKAPGG